MHLCVVCLVGWAYAGCTQRPVKGIGSLGSGARESCEMPGCWKLSLGSLEEKVLITSEHPLQPHGFVSILRARRGLI